MRSQKRANFIPQILPLLRSALSKNVSLALWLIESFTYEHIVWEFLVDNPVPEMRAFIGGLIKVGLKCVYEYEWYEVQKLVKLHEDAEICLDKSK